MPSNIKKLSASTTINNGDVRSDGLFYFVQNSGTAYASYALTFADMFLATKVITSVNFNSNAFTLSGSQVSINGVPTTGDIFQVNGSSYFNGSSVYTQNLTVGGNITSSSDISANGNMTIAKTSVLSGNTTINGTFLANSSVTINGSTHIANNVTITGTITTNNISIGSVVSSNTSSPKSSYSELIGIIYPVGSIYLSTANTNPNVLFGVGTWVAWGTGRVPVGVDTSSNTFNTVEKTGGTANSSVILHNHSATSTSSSTIAITDPGHLHSATVGIVVSATAGVVDIRGCSMQTINTSSATTGISATATTTTDTTVDSTGVAGTNLNLQPYITCYMWKRTA